jgi:hypothetical protein
MSAITTQDLPSAFAGKNHALLCRSYAKGRDWYDFLWYVNKMIVPNMALLHAALVQQGPWQDQTIELTPDWLLRELRTIIQQNPWPEIVQDVRRFLPASRQGQLDLWNAEFFLYHLDKLGETLS